MWDKVIHGWLGVPYTLHVRVDHRPKKARATVLFLHGIGNSGAAWDEVIDKLPDTIRLVTIDLLGFGNSKQPVWATYDAKTQARAIFATYLRLRIKGPVVIVGHSLGALIAVEIAKRYPLLVKSLILCCPPFYKIDETKRRMVPSADRLLKDIYQLVRRHPDEFIQITTLATRLGLVNKSFHLTSANATSYMSALEASIINQTSLPDALALRIPIHILYGKLDAVVVTKNLRYLADHNNYVDLMPVMGAHEVSGSTWVNKVMDAITSQIQSNTL